MLNIFQYPLSSIIAAEWSSTESRGTMLAAVFSMQSVSRLLAFAVNLGAIRDFNLANSIESQLAADRAWRLTIGVGAIPAIIAVVFRLTIPETPRYYADIMKDLRKAVKNALKVYGRNKKVNSVNTDSSPQNGDEENDHWFQGAWNFLTGPKKAWKNLTSISVLWAILDVAWYGLSFDSPSALSTLTHVPSSSSPWNPTNCTSQWDTDSWKSSITIHDMLQEDSIRSILIVSIASLVGSLTAIVIINRFRRKLILVTTFLFLSLLFAISGGTLIGTYRANENHTVTTAFYAILQFVFNMGPNTLIFVLAAEMFPTVYRGTFYGIAAASGKIGAICIRAIAARTGDKEMSLGIRLLAFIPFMLLAALISTTLPDVQYLPQKIDIEASVEQQAGPPESDNRSPEEENAMPRPDQPQVPDGEDAIQRASTSSDGTSLHALEPNQPEHEAQKAWFLGRLKNKALEEIAPNPAWDRTERNGVKKKAKESASGAT
jgi:PHS family inorganic phosphate transporter-like MFS transporter